MSKKSNADETLANKIARLDEMVDWFAGEDFSLDEAVGKFKAADSLAREIETDLAGLKNEINLLAERFDG